MVFRKAIRGLLVACGGSLAQQLEFEGFRGKDEGALALVEIEDGGRQHARPLPDAVQQEGLAARLD